jgi:hypothetical protein
LSLLSLHIQHIPNSHHSEFGRLERWDTEARILARSRWSSRHGAWRTEVRACDGCQGLIGRGGQERGKDRVHSEFVSVTVQDPSRELRGLTGSDWLG